MDKVVPGLDSPADEDVLAVGFLTYDEDDSSGFMMKPVDMRGHLKDDLLALAVGAKCVVMATSKRQLIRKKFERSEEYRIIALPYKGVMSKVNLYMDLSGYHCIAVVSQKAIFYLNLKSEISQPLLKLQGLDITSLVFPSDTQLNTTGNLIFGTSEGSIYTYKLDVYEEEQILESEVSCVFQLPSKAPICGLAYETYQTGEDGSGVCALVMAVTSDTCYQFVGRPPLSEMFQKYKDPKELDQNKKSVPQNDFKQSELKVFYTHDEEGGFELNSFAWKTGVGVCHGKFRRKDDFKADVIVKEFPVDTYQRDGAAAGTEIPIPLTVGINDYHLFLLYQDNLTVVSQITQQIDCSEDFKPMEKMLGMEYEPTTSAVWIYSARSLHKLVIAAASRDLWRQHLENANYEESLRICKESKNKYYGYAAGIYADKEFQEHEYLKAAELFAVSNRHFEEIVIKFLLASENNGLELYLMKKLAQFPNIKETFVQRVLLCSWLIELKLDKLNKLSATAGGTVGEGDPSNRQQLREEAVNQYNKLSEEFRGFLAEYEESIEADVVFQLLQNYGRLEDCLWFAKQKKNYDAVVLYYIDNKDIKRALEVISGMPEGRKKNELMTRYASVFMKYEPKDTIESLMSSFPDINVEILMPALMSIENKYRLYANTFVKQSVGKSNDKLLYNLYIFFLAQSDDQASADELLVFLETQEAYQRRSMPINFDKDFALNVFKFFGRTTALIRTYGMLELYEEAVRLAMATKQIDLAKGYASLPSEEGLKRRLWLDIAKEVMTKIRPDMQTSFELVKESQGNLVLNDVLPFVSPKLKLQTFRDDILSQVNMYDNKINESRETISTYNKIAQEVAEQQKEIQNSPMYVRPDKCCDKCATLLANAGKLFVFPCLHAFHRGCLIDWYEAYRIFAGGSKKVKVEMMERCGAKMQELLVLKRYPLSGATGRLLLDSVEAALAERKKDAVEKRMNEDEYAYLDGLVKQFEELLTDECILCGEIAIEKVDSPFDSPDEIAWAIQPLFTHSHTTQ